MEIGSANSASVTADLRTPQRTPQQSQPARSEAPPPPPPEPPERLESANTNSRIGSQIDITV